MDRELPVRLDSQLDALLDEQDSADQATADADDLDDQTDLDTTGADGDDEGDDSPGAAASESDEDDDESADSGADSGAEDEWAGVPPAVRQRLEAAERTAAQLEQREAQREEEAKQARAEQQYNAWFKSLEDMDPEDRQAEVIKVLSEGYGAELRQKEQARQNRIAQEQFTQQHTASLEFVSQGHRVEPTGRILPDGKAEYRRTDGASLPLTEHEKRIVAKVTGGPLAMQEAANELVAMRRGQTAAARTALANKRRAENEGPTLTPGRQGSGPRQVDRPDYASARNVSDKLDLLLDYQDQQYGGPLATAGRR